MHVYLSGGMEYARNEGKDWREEMENWIKKSLRHKVFNPNVKSKTYLDKILPNNNFRLLKSTDIKAYIKIVKRFVEIDTHEIATRSDYIICYWDKGASRGAGTKGELTIARYFDKPVYMVTAISQKNIPGWVLGCVTEFFDSFHQLKTFLLKTYHTN